MARCGACGRPPQSEIDAGREVLLPREAADQGCFAEFQAEYARLKATVPAPSDKEASDRALAFAQGKHQNREHTAYEATIELRLERNAAGLHALTGATLTATGATLIQIKADAQERLDAFNAVRDPAAKSPGEKFKEALGL